MAAPSLVALLMAASGRPVDFGQAKSVTSLLTSAYQLEFLLGCGVAVLAAVADATSGQPLQAR